MTNFVPDRSNRPSDADDPTGGTTEVGAGRTKTLELSDGRVAVVEAARVDGFTCVYYYFDSSGLDEATDDELEVFLRDSGVALAPKDSEVRAAFGARKKRDAQGRQIWEVQLTYWD